MAEIQSSIDPIEAQRQGLLSQLQEGQGLRRVTQQIEITPKPELGEGRYGAMPYTVSRTIGWEIVELDLEAVDESLPSLKDNEEDYRHDMSW